MGRLTLLGAGEAGAAFEDFDPFAINGLLRAFDSRDIHVSQGGSVQEWVSQDETLTATSVVAPVMGSNGEVDFQGAGYMHANPYISGATRHLLPDSPIAPNPSGGFTNTGIDRHPDGRWIIACDGRETASDLTYSPHVVIISSDLTTVLSTVDLSGISGIESVQGVTYDSSDDTIWVADLANKTIWHYDLDGVDQEDEIVTTEEPHGVAYNSANDTLFVSRSTGGTIEVRSCVDGTQVSTFDFPLTTIDMICYDGRYIYATTDGTPGDVWVGTASGKLVHIYYGLEDAEAIEGIYVEDGKFWVCHDGGFHTSTSFPRSAVLEYDIVDIPDNAVPSTLLWTGLVSRTDTIGTGALQAFYDPTNGTGGWGLYWVNAASSVRLIGRSGGTTNTITWPCDAVSDAVLLRLEITDETTFALYVNGVEATPSATTNDMTLYTLGFSVAALSFNSEYQGQLIGKSRIYGVIMGSDLAEAEKAEGYLAWRHGREDLLPSGSQFEFIDPTWNPSKLYAGDRLGGYWDFLELDKVKQLSDGTTAVTAEDDPIGYWLSHQGSIALGQATEATRPLYKGSGATGHLFTDDTNDKLSDLTGSASAFIFAHNGLGMSAWVVATPPGTESKSFFGTKSATTTAQVGFTIEQISSTQRPRFILTGAGAHVINLTPASGTPWPNSSTMLCGVSHSSVAGARILMDAVEVATAADAVAPSLANHGTALSVPPITSTGPDDVRGVGVINRILTDPEWTLLLLYYQARGVM